MTDDVKIPCKSCSQSFTVSDTVKVHAGQVAGKECPKCSGTVVFARCECCAKIYDPTFHCDNCKTSTDPAPAIAPNDDDSPNSQELPATPGPESVQHADPVDQQLLVDEIRELKQLVRALSENLESKPVSDPEPQPDKTAQRLERVADKLSREIANAHTAVDEAHQATRTDLNTIAGKIDNSSQRTLEQIQQTCKVITDGIQDGVLSKLEHDLAPSLVQIGGKLKQLRTDLATIHAWTQDALQGPHERRSSTVSDVVEYWTKSLARKLSKDIKAIAESPQTDKKSKTDKKSTESEPASSQPMHLDVDGMTRLLGVLEKKRGLEIIRDLPELFNSVDDRLREKRRTQSDSPDNESVGETIDTLVRVQLRMRAWQAQNDFIRLPREENEPVDFRYHFPVGSETTSDSELDRRIKEIKTTGYVFCDGDDEVVLQKAEVIVWEFEESDE
jgi:hypothetical protein